MSGYVNILLSTFNAEPYLEEQLNSLLAQTYHPITITARDDGSTDGSYQKLLIYSKLNDNIRLLDSARMGVISSYFTLLRQTGPFYDFYAFCDQDDVWLPNKISDAISLLQNCDPSNPLMYFSRLEYVDTQLRHLGYSKVYRRFGFANALVENIASGCTVVLNRVARNLICGQNPTTVAMHDWWCYIVISAIGQILFDDRPNIKYRQHTGNTVGSPTNSYQLLVRRLKRYFDPRKHGIRASHQAEEFYRCYGHCLPQHELAILKSFLNTRKSLPYRLRYSRKIAVWKQNPIENRMLPLRVVLGRI